MRTAVVFASKHSTTADVARRIARELQEASSADDQVDLLDLADGRPDLTGVDLVVLGTPIYAGTGLPEMKELVGAGIPASARVGLFVTGMVTDAAGKTRELTNAFPEDLNRRAIARAFLGGRLRFARMSNFERLIAASMAKTRSDVDALDEDALEGFIAALRP